MSLSVGCVVPAMAELRVSLKCGAYLIGPRRMSPQARGGVVDPADVGADHLAVHASRDDVVRVVGARAAQVVNHQVPTVRFDRELEPLDRSEQAGAVVRILG